MSEATKDFLITIAWVIGAILVCGFAFIFLMRGVLELSQEYKTITTANVKNAGVSSSNYSSTSTTEESQWVKYVSPTNDFSALFPQQPHNSISHQGSFILNVYEAVSGDETYEVNRITSQESLDEVTPESLISMVEGLAQSHNEVIESVYFDQNSKVLRFALRNKNDDTMTKGIVMQKNNVTLYVLQYGCSERSCSEEHYQYFVSHFVSA